MIFAVHVDPEQVKIMEPENVDDSGWLGLDALPDPLRSQFALFFEQFKDKFHQTIRSSYQR